MKTSSFIRYVVSILLLFVYSQAAYSQSPQDPQSPKHPTIRGHVYDENNEGLPKAAVMLWDVGLSGPGTPFVAVVCQEDGSFEIDALNDSVLLQASWLGYKSVKMKVPRDCEVDINMEPDPLALDPDIIIGDPPAIPRRLRTGYIFDAKGKPVSGTHILVKEEDIDIDKETSSNNDGYFEIRGGDFAELTIKVKGHKPKKLDLAALKKKGEESMLVKHDGLFIVIDFNW